MDIEQLEALALGDDRDAALAALVPGSEDHDTWRAIALQHQGALDEVDRILESWRSRHGDTAARRRLERRQLLLRIGADQAEYADQLIDAAGLELQHEAEVEAAAARYPTRLDDAPLALERVIADAIAASRTLERLTAAALPLVVARPLDAGRRRALLERIDRTGLPGLIEAIAADLDEKSSRGFGSLAIHGRLTADELTELARLRPAVIDQRPWVEAMVARLQPAPEVDLDVELEVRADYLDRLWALAARLAPTFNGLKVHVLHWRLELDRRLDRLDRGRLLAYLALPRRASYVRGRWLDGLDRATIAALDGSAPATRLPVVTDDEPLVRAYLGHFLVDEDAAAFAGFVDSDWLERLQAEVRLLAGAQDGDRWSQRLGAQAAAALRDRVDLELLPTNPARFAAGARVALDVAIKHVPTLRVRVFRMNPLAYFQGRGGEVDTAIDLDGLAAGWEEVRTLDAPAMVRRRERIELPACDRPGTYVVELIGGGRASRALVRKGWLRATARPSAAGIAVTVVDDEGQPRPDATLWLGGREHRAREGTITIPFSTRPGPNAALLVHGDLASVTRIDLIGETPALVAAVLLDRQALVPGKDALALIRPALTVGGNPITLALLEDAYVEVVSTDRAGVPARRRQPLAVADDRDSELTIPVADDLARLELTIGGRYRIVSEQRTVDLAHPVAIDVGTLHAGDATEALYLAWSTAGYTLRLLGKSGEPRAGRAVSLSLAHWATDRTVDVTLATDERGAIELGPVDGVTAVTAAAGGESQRFDLGAPRPQHATELTLAAGEAAALPAPAGLARGAGAGLDWYALEWRGTAPVRHVGDRFAVDGELLRIGGLEPGTYQLVVRGQAPVTLRVAAADAPQTKGWAAGPTLLHELRPLPAAIAAITADDEAITVQIEDAGDDTRVHVVATPFLPAPAWSIDLAAAIRAPATRWTAPPRSQYVSGRDIGDEYRYVLDRQHAAHRPGVMLDRPGLLLNPWALRTTATAVQDARPQAAWAAAPPPAGAPASAGYAMAKADQAAAGTGPSFAPHDFLADAPVVLANLRPDDDGVVRVARAALAGAQVVRVLCVDPAATSQRTVPLPPRAPAVRDLRLAAALPADRHLREDRRLVPLPAGAELAVADRATSRVELVDTVDKLYRALCALSGDATLASWDFLPRWPSLPRSERLRLYSKHGCHELAIFIRWKDPELFAEAIGPYLASKLHPTFVDRALTGDDLTPYLATWRLARLNAFERALLARHLAAARAGLGKNLADEVDLIPPDPSADDRLVDALLAGGALGGDGTALHEVADEQNELAMDLLEAPMAGAAAGFGAGGGAAPASRAMGRSEKAKKVGRRRAADSDRDDADDRQAAAPMYRAADRTEELAEHNWWHQRVGDPAAALIPPRRLWRDLALHARPVGPERGASNASAESKEPFLSPHLADAATGLAACMCVLAVIDLPFTAGAHPIAARGDGATVRAASHALAAVAELADVAGPPSGEVLVGQSYFRQDDRFEWDGAVQREKYVTGELCTGVVYQCQVVVTNPSSRVRRLAVLTQIPAGAIATSGGRATRTVRVELGAYATTTIEYAFYFPAAGGFAHYPAQVVDGDALVAAAAPRTLTVVAVPTEGDAGSWPHVSQRGSLDDVVAFLAAANLGRVDLERVAWRMRDRDAFERITAALAARHTFDATLWAYAFLHDDRARAAEWLSHADDFLAEAGPFLDGGPVDLEPVARARYQHLEYAPLVNARAHRLGDRRTILNGGLAAQWRAFLELVASRRRPRPEDWLAAATYLFTMDRPEDALRALARAHHPVHPERGASAASTESKETAFALQRDYLAAYAAAGTGDLATARAHATRHVEHPVDRWRHRFAAVIAMLDELEGKGAASSGDPDSRDQRMAELAAQQPTLAVRVEGATIVVDSTLLAAATLRFYRMDVELLFSRQPFLAAGGDRFSFIEPGRVDELALSPSGQTRTALPAELAATNVVVEVAAGALRAAVSHFAHDLAVAVSAAYGQLQVRRASTGAPLPATYVKCYARMRGGAVQFYKDGYTDLRGRLDYATLSTDELDRVERFALLVTHDHAGATVVEAAPPPR